MSDLPDIRKVTALITRDAPHGRDLLVFYRPDDGMTQLPAGTVEDGESPDTAVLREVMEETGLVAVRITRKLGIVRQKLEGDSRVALVSHPLCDAQDHDCDGFLIRRGLTVYLQEQAADWSRVLYREYGYDPAQEKLVTAWEKVGWLPTHILTDHTERHFYHLISTEPTPERWMVYDGDDNGRVLELYWTPLGGEPVIIPQQRWWIEQFREQLGTD